MIKNCVEKLNTVALGGNTKPGSHTIFQRLHADKTLQNMANAASAVMLLLLCKSAAAVLYRQHGATIRYRYFFDATEKRAIPGEVFKAAGRTATPAMGTYATDFPLPLYITTCAKRQHHPVLLQRGL